jgi:tRNA pseudouridine55 synthase
MVSDGIILLSKPRGWTSREAVDFVAKIFKMRRVGHAGTLDPLATGLLVICLGKATRLVRFLQELWKEYLAVFRLGCTSPTDDIEGELTEISGVTPPAEEDLRNCLASFQGRILQRPPVYSAVKIRGERAYSLARRGEPPELRPREVEIRRIELCCYDYPRLELIVECSGGTYIRSLARDIGQRLGCGAVLEALTRLKVGSLTLSEAVTPEALTCENPWIHLRPPSDALRHLPQVFLEAPQVAALLRGQPITCAESVGEIPLGSHVAVLDHNNKLYGVATVIGRGRLKPTVNLQSQL